MDTPYSQTSVLDTFWASKIVAYNELSLTEGYPEGYSLTGLGKESSVHWTLLILKIKTS